MFTLLLWTLRDPTPLNSNMYASTPQLHYRQLLIFLDYSPWGIQQRGYKPRRRLLSHAGSNLLVTFLVFVFCNVIFEAIQHGLIASQIHLRLQHGAS